MPRVRKAVTLLELATGNAARKRSAASYLEFAEQEKFADWCRGHAQIKDLAWSAMLDGVNLGKRAAALGWRKGNRKGKPDFLLFERSRPIEGLGLFSGLALEFKSPTGKGRLSKEQKEWMERLTASGWWCESVTTFGEARHAMLKYLNLTD